MLRPNIFIFSQSDQRPFSVLLRVYKSSFHRVVLSNVQPCNGFKFPHFKFKFPDELSLIVTGASHFMHSSLVDQLYANVINSVTKSNNLVQYAPNIHPNIFKGFHRTVIHGESYGIFINPSPLDEVSLHFTIEPLPFVTSSFCFIRTLKTIEKHILSSLEIITDCQI